MRAPCDCVEFLKAAAAAELENAHKAARSPKLKPHHDLLWRRFHALGWAAGALRDRAPPPLPDGPPPLPPPGDQAE